MAKAKDNRCWPGYEPVKKKKANSQGSCRPKAKSKLTPPEKEFRAKRRRQLDRWQEEHPGARPSAAQHLRAPGMSKKGAKPAKPKPSIRKKAAAKGRAPNRKP